MRSVRISFLRDAYVTRKSAEILIRFGACFSAARKKADAAGHQLDKLGFINLPYETSLILPAVIQMLQSNTLHKARLL